MNVKFLGHPTSPIKFYLQEREGHYREGDSVDWIVSHGYRRLVTPAELATVPPQHALNCHIGYLPWGRGADPNFWAWVDEVPHGVTIHIMDEGLDTGPIVSQVQVWMAVYEHTFRTSYHRLQATLYGLFPSVWEQVREGSVVGHPQPTEVNLPTHTAAEKVPYLTHLDKGWDTRIEDFLRRVRA